MDSYVLYLIGQSFIIIGAMLVAYLKIRIAIAELKVYVGFVKEITTGLQNDHKGLTKKVDGISRHVERLEAMHMNCPYVKGETPKAS